MAAHITNKFFLALIPHAHVVPGIDEIANAAQAEHGLGGPTLGSSRYHVTLQTLGCFEDFPADLIPMIDQSVAPLAAGANPFSMSFDHALSFKNGNPKCPFVLRNLEKNQSLLAFRRELAACLGCRTSTFTPHITLLYDTKIIPEHPVPAVKWTATELVLVRSYVGLSKHEHLASWPFLGKQRSPQQIDLPLIF